MAAQKVLEDVVACIMGQANAKAAIADRIEKHGGRVAARLGKEVSHIVWERRHSRRPSDKAADEAELLELFHKLEKMDYPPVVVSPLWVEESIKSRRRLVERKYLVKKPTESLLGRTPGSSAGAAKKRKRPAAAALPKPAEAYELDDLHFSSTQQLHNGDNQAGPSNADAAPGGAKQPRQGRAAAGRAAKQQRGGGGRQAAANMPTVVELLSEEEEEGWEGGAEQQQQERSRVGKQEAAVKIGADTQAVANILTIDLPDDEQLGRTPGGALGVLGEADEDDLDTPLALRFARSSTEHAAGWGSAGSSGGRRGAAAAAAAAAEKRSRLALASGPQQAEAADGEGEQALADVGGVEEMHVEEAAAADEQMDEVPPTQDREEEQQQAQQLQLKDKAGREAAAAKGVASRFSVRQLVQHPEKPVVVHKGTPLPGSLPASPEDGKSAQPIPVPVVDRVDSPWAQAEQLPTQTPASQAEAAAAKVGKPAGRPSLGHAKAGRRSLLGVSNIRRASGVGGGTGGSPADAAAQPAPDAPPDGKLPTPWSTLRPWDGQAAAQKAGGGRDENQAGPPQQQQQEQQTGQQGKGSTKRAAQQEAGAEPASKPSTAAVGSSSCGAGPSTGCIALTSVEEGVVDLAKSATRRLRGLRLCPEGREEGLVTHLVIGGERRTLKLMLAVANGAWLLSPQWVTASLEAGRWLPESQFPAKVRFEAAAERARSLLEDPDALPLLHDRSIYIHLPDRARKLMAGNAAALKRVAGVLGAKVVPPKACNLCVVVGGGGRPPHIPAQVQCVKEEWLLLAAERFELPPMEDHSLE